MLLCEWPSSFLQLCPAGFQLLYLLYSPEFFHRHLSKLIVFAFNTQHNGACQNLLSLFGKALAKSPEMNCFVAIIQKFNNDKRKECQSCTREISTMFQKISCLSEVILKCFKCFLMYQDKLCQISFQHFLLYNIPSVVKMHNVV